MCEKMRLVPTYEKKKRGCIECLDAVPRYGADGRTAGVECPHAECPYHVLDKYDTYEKYMASEDCKILVNEFFPTVATIYESTNHHVAKRIFSDGDHGVTL